MPGEMGSCCVTPSKVHVVVLLLLLHCSITFSQTTGGTNVTARPKVVNVGALFSLNSTIGKAAKVAIDAAVDDINSNSSILSGTKLVINTHDTNCSGFLGIVEALHFMETDTVAIIGPQSSELAHVISHVANELQVPLLSFASTDPTLSSLQYPFFVRTINSDLFQMSAIAEIVDFYKWRQVIAIFLDDDYGRNGVAALGDKLAERRCKVSYKAALRPGATKSDVTDLLVKVVLMESRVIVLHANPNSGLTVLSVARSLGMMGNGYVWIATDWLSSWLDTSHLDSVNMDNLQGVIGLRQHTADTDRKRTLTSRWSNLTQQKGGVFGMNAYALYAYDTVWIVARAIDAFFNNGGVVSFSNDSRIKDKGGNLHLESMSIFNGGSLLLNEILKTDMIGVTGTVQFDSARQFIHPAYDIINVVGNGFRGVGYWSNYSGLSVVPPETLYKRLANRSRASQQLYPVIWPGQTVTKPRGWAFPNNGVELKIGYPLRATYKQFLSRANGSDVVRGYCIDVFTAAVSLLPYAVPVKFVPFGDGLKNPSYTELVNRVASGELDGAIGDIAIVTNRTKIVDFTQPYIESGLVILTSIKKQKPNTWAFLQPFTLEMWLVTGGFFLVIGIVVWILEHRLNDEFRGPPRKQIVTICWFTFSTLFFSHKENTVSTLGRFVLLIWLFVVLIIQSSYTASLTSILTVQQLSSPIKGIDSLIASKDPIGFQVGSFAENYMIEDLGISKSRLRTLNTPDDYARALELGPENGGVMAVVDERPYVDLFLSTHCKFTVIGSEFTKSGWGFAFPRDSPLAVDMSTAILTLSENGDLQRISDKWLARSACSSDSTQLDSARLHLSSFSGLFLICGTACVIALLIYLFLVLRKFYRDRHSQEVDDSSKSGGSRSFVGLQRFLSFYDEKEQEAKERRKKKILEGSSSNGSSGGFSSVP